MYPGDAESRWPSTILTDARVVHRWDEPKTAGRWFLEHLPELRPSRRVDGRYPQDVDAMWDTWLLFDRTAAWTDKPTGLVSWGYTIMKTRSQLAQDLDAVISDR